MLEGPDPMTCRSADFEYAREQISKPQMDPAALRNEM